MLHRASNSSFWDADNLAVVAAAVYLDGERLHMAVGENEQEHILGLASGELMVTWQMHRPDAGQAVEIITGARLYCFYYYTLFLPRRQGASADKLQVKATILPLALSPNPSKTQSTVGTVLSNFTGPRQPGPVGALKEPLICSCMQLTHWEPSAASSSCCSLFLAKQNVAVPWSSTSHLCIQLHWLKNPCVLRRSADLWAINMIKRMLFWQRLLLRSQASTLLVRGSVTMPSPCMCVSCEC